MTRILCNIPHSGTRIPEWASGDILISEQDLNKLLEFMTDVDVDKLWSFVPEENKVVAEISRLILDTERFREDKDEPMTKRGMGLYYTHTPEGTVFRRKTPESYTKCLHLYDAYHAGFQDSVARRLNAFGSCVILDCHSFHDGMTYTGFDPADFPDVCLGINGAMSPEAELVADTFRTAGYSVKINEPFSGSLVPLVYLNDPRVVSVMIELNRRVYQEHAFRKMQVLCQTVYEKLSTIDIRDNIPHGC